MSQLAVDFKSLYRRVVPLLRRFEDGVDVTLYFRDEAVELTAALEVSLTALLEQLLDMEQFYKAIKADDFMEDDYLRCESQYKGLRRRLDSIEEDPYLYAYFYAVDTERILLVKEFSNLLQRGIDGRMARLARQFAVRTRYDDIDMGADVGYMETWREAGNFDDDVSYYAR